MAESDDLDGGDLFGTLRPPAADEALSFVTEFVNKVAVARGCSCRGGGPLA